VQITANVTGTRSINTMNALRTVPSGSDANTVSLVKEAAILTGGFGTAQPTLQTNGNFTAAGGDVFRIGDLFHGSAPAGKTIAGYRLALGDGGGKLTLNGADVSGRTSFTADEFAHLSYMAGAEGSRQSLVVVAQTGTRLKNGTLTQTVDSQAVQINSDVTGSRSINAMGALSSVPTGADANTVSIVKESTILTGGFGSARPTLQTDGNFTAAGGDVFRLSDLFKAGAPTGKTIAGYRLALGGSGGQLTLNGSDVSGRTSFTADEFAHLNYTAGTNGSQQSLVVVAQTGIRLKGGLLSQVVDSPAVQITADVTGTRSINAMNALSTVTTGADANTVSIAKEAGILTGGFGTAQPTLQTEGNFTAAKGDVFRMSDLFRASAPTGKTIAGYRLALGDGGGQLTLNGTDVSGRTSFTADEFAHLSYTAGADGSQQSLVAVAQTGVRLKGGTLMQVVDSQAVQLTAAVTGSRSINAMGALVGVPSGPDANTVSIVKEAAILAGGFGSAQPALQTNGNFTATEGDIFRVGDLFQASAPTGKTIAGYRLALGAGSGQLTLSGADVSSRTSFTADEFAHLSYTAGANGMQQSLIVAAQTGIRQKNGTLTQVVDSPAVQITADVTGTRSMNAMNALRTVPSGADFNAINIVKEAAILTGGFGSAQPTLQSVVTSEPTLSPTVLSKAIGAYNSAGPTVVGSATNLSSFYQEAPGSSGSPGVFSDPSGPVALALLLLDEDAPGAFRTANNLAAQSVAIKAYDTSSGP
jgi:hypothetical protein